VGGARIEGTDDEQICYIVDLSEIRRAEAALRRSEVQARESELRYRILAEALPEIVMVTNADRQPIFVNQHYCDYTGLTLGDLSSGWLHVIHPDDLPRVKTLRATGEPYEIEYRLRRADGVYRWHFARVLKLPADAAGARWLAVAMDIDDRRRAEDALRFIERAGTRLARSLDLTTTFDTLLELVVPEFGDWATITLRGDDGELRTIAGRHRDPAKNEFVARLFNVEYLRESYAGGTAATYRTGEPQILANLTRGYVEDAVRAEFLPAILELGFGSTIVLPIIDEAEVIGSISIYSAASTGREYRRSDITPLEELARRAGYAIVNARRFDRERRVASILQEAALPRTLPTIPGLRFDGYYRAGRDEASIGGDWYDAFAVANQRIVISVGDVAGSGLQAAVLMGTVRQIIRGAAHVDTDPAMMIDIADRTLRSDGEPRMVTAFVGVIDIAAHRMTYASAGHVPALLQTRDGRIAELSAQGPPLGMRDLAPSETRTIDLPEDSRLLLYTDGLVEWSRDIIEGEERLRKCFAAVALDDDGHPARSIVDAVLPPGGARDDVAALLVTID
jgi:PAS domain S-box-containing protein